jgi:hypothetical protein
MNRIILYVITLRVPWNMYVNQFMRRVCVWYNQPTFEANDITCIKILSISMCFCQHSIITVERKLPDFGEYCRHSKHLLILRNKQQCNPLIQSCPLKGLFCDWQALIGTTFLKHYVKEPCRYAIFGFTFRLIRCVCMFITKSLWLKIHAPFINYLHGTGTPLSCS